MADLAIKGHPTRGKEVIQLLEMLGANRLGYKDTFVGFYYYIECGAICSSDECPIDAKVFTLEQFEEKYPYKVGDKVELNGIGVEITGMYWLDNTINYEGESIKLGSEYDCLSVQDLKPYKEETMEEKNNDNWSKWELPDGYEFQDEEGNVIKTGVIKLVKKQPQYPKTYDECCRVLGISDGEFMFAGLSDDEYNLFDNFVMLKRCRDAYWKIAGEQMRLDKPWEPDWGENDGGYRYCICNRSNKIVLSNEWLGENYILSFPTAEMRDAFYENFKDLIDSCKELL